MSTWAAYYAAQIVSTITFAALTLYGIKRDWEGAVIVFGIATLLVGCNMVKPA